MKKLSVISIFILCALFKAESQDYSFPLLKGYKIEANYPVFTPDNLWDFIDGAADNYLSYGFENVHVREYVKGKTKIKVEIYKHKDPDNTFGIYASERSPSYRYVNLGTQGYIIDGTINFFKGHFYVKMSTYSGDDKVHRDMESLAWKLSDMLPDDAALPEALTELPDNNKVKYSEIFINQSVLGHDFLHGAFKANYSLNGNNFQIYLFKHSPEEIIKMVKLYLSSVSMDTSDSSEGKYAFKDGYNGDIFLGWKGSKAIIISGLTKDQTDIANLYIDNILHN